MNAAAYVFTVLAARALGPSGYSAVAALMGVVLVANVAALGVQATTARRIATDEDTDPAVLVVAGGRVALALSVACLGLSPVAAVVLHLDTWLTAATVAVTTGALTLTGVQLGLLQGRRNWRGFALLSGASGGGRLLLGGASLWLWPTPLGAMTGVALGTVVPVVVGHLLLDARLVAGPTPGSWRGALGEALHDSHTLLAFFALTQVDVFAARATLPAEESGLYASGLILTKAVLFLPGFVAVVAFPALARRGGRRHLHHAGLVIVLGIGLVTVAAVLLLPGVALAFVGGSAYAAVQPYLWLFAVLGTVAGMVQLLVQTALARRHRVAVWWVWAAFAAVLAGVPFVGSGPELLGLVLAVDTVLLGVLVVVTWPGRADPDAPGHPTSGTEASTPAGPRTALSVRRRARSVRPRR